jgi:hypothetical protein
MSPDFYDWTDWMRVLYHGIRVELLVSISSGYVIFRCAYSTLTSVRWVHRHDCVWAGADNANSYGSHVEDGMLDYSIRGCSSLPYYLSFMIELTKWGSSSNMKWGWANPVLYLFVSTAICIQTKESTKRAIYGPKNYYTFFFLSRFKLHTRRPEWRSRNDLHYYI